MSSIAQSSNEVNKEKILIGNILEDVHDEEPKHRLKITHGNINVEDDRSGVLLTNADRLDLNKHRPPSAPPAFLERSWNIGSLQSTPISSTKKSPNTSRQLPDSQYNEQEEFFIYENKEEGSVVDKIQNDFPNSPSTQVEMPSKITQMDVPQKQSVRRLDYDNKKVEEDNYLMDNSNRNFEQMNITNNINNNITQIQQYQLQNAPNYNQNKNDINNSLSSDISHINNHNIYPSAPLVMNQAIFNPPQNNYPPNINPFQSDYNQNDAINNYMGHLFQSNTNNEINYNKNIKNYNYNSSDVYCANNIQSSYNYEENKNNSIDKRNDSQHAQIVEDINNNIKDKKVFDGSCSIPDLAIDQQASRLIQNKIESGTSQERDYIFEKLYSHILPLSIDVFGNYSVQKLLEFCNKEQQVLLTTVLGYHAANISTNAQGCKAIQKALDVLPATLKLELAKSILTSENLNKLSTDQNGNHVIQKLIEKVVVTDNSRNKYNSVNILLPLLESFKSHAYELSTHPLGCRVIQRLLETIPSENLANFIVDEIIYHVTDLCEDKYGNYVIQHILVHSSEKQKLLIQDVVKNNILTLSMHKFSSNVVEKCLAYGNEEQKSTVMDKILDWPSRRHTQSVVLTQMMKDMYGNYVIQKALEVSKGAQLDSLVYQIKEQSALLKKVRYGRHIISCVEKISNNKNINAQ